MKSESKLISKLKIQFKQKKLHLLIQENWTFLKIFKFSIKKSEIETFF